MPFLSKEWVDALALRRVYYLESSHFEIRREELEASAEYLGDSSSDDKDLDVENRGIRWRRQVNKALSKGKDRYRKKNQNLNGYVLHGSHIPNKGELFQI